MRVIETCDLEMVSAGAKITTIKGAIKNGLDWLSRVTTAYDAASATASAVNSTNQGGQAGYVDQMGNVAFSSGSGDGGGSSGSDGGWVF